MKRVLGKPRTLWFAAFAIFGFWRTDVASASETCLSTIRIGGAMNNAEMRQRIVDLISEDWRVFGYIELSLRLWRASLTQAPSALLRDCDLPKIILEPALRGSAATWPDLAIRFPALGS